MVDLAGLKIEGVSIGGHQTCLCVPHYKLAFDIGRCPSIAVGMHTVLFTHAHVDHMGGVAHHCATRALLKMAPPTYVVPHVNVESFNKLFAVWRELDGNELPHRVISLAPGEDVLLRKGLRARAFPSTHRKPCQGYVLYSEREKLLPELAGASPETIAERRDAGLAITSTLSEAELAFTGDTTIEGLLACTEALHAKRLMLEVTFLDERVSRSMAHDKGHIHLTDVIENASAFQNEALLFTHFSARYSPAQIKSILRSKLPPSLRERVTPMLP